MNLARRSPVPCVGLSFAAALLLTGCLGPDLGSTADPLVVTENGSVSYAEPRSAEQEQAIAEMRVRAAAAESLPYPSGGEGARMARLPNRDEPDSVAEVAALEAELAALARRQQAAGRVDIAAMRAREAELRRLLAAAQAGRLRQ